MTSWNVIITTRYVSIFSERCPIYQTLIPHQSNIYTICIFIVRCGVAVNTVLLCSMKEKNLNS